MGIARLRRPAAAFCVCNPKRDEESAESTIGGSPQASAREAGVDQHDRKQSEHRDPETNFDDRACSQDLQLREIPACGLTKDENDRREGHDRDRDLGHRKKEVCVLRQC